MIFSALSIGNYSWDELSIFHVLATAEEALSNRMWQKIKIQKGALSVVSI